MQICQGGTILLCERQFIRGCRGKSSGGFWTVHSSQRSSLRFIFKLPTSGKIAVFRTVRQSNTVREFDLGGSTSRPGRICRKTRLNQNLVGFGDPNLWCHICSAPNIYQKLFAIEGG